MVSSSVHHIFVQDHEDADHHRGIERWVRRGQMIKPTSRLATARRAVHETFEDAVGWLKPGQLTDETHKQLGWINLFASNRPRRASWPWCRWPGPLPMTCTPVAYALHPQDHGPHRAPNAMGANASSACKRSTKCILVANLGS